MQPYGGGWICPQGTGETTVGHRALTEVIVSALLVGTGGLMTPDYFAKRNERGYKFNQVKILSGHRGVALRLPAENMAHIRAVMKLAVSELSLLLGVSRQAIYDWQNGAQPSPHNAERLEDLAKAADVFLAEGIVVTPRLLKRRIAGGKTFFDNIRDGGSTEHAARSLVQTIRRELEQRKALDARLAGRKPPSMDYTDVGVPTLDNRV